MANEAHTALMRPCLRGHSRQNSTLFYISSPFSKHTAPAFNDHLLTSELVRTRPCQRYCVIEWVRAR